MLIEIKSAFNGNVIWSGKAATLGDAVLKALAEKKSLYGANLRGADLHGALNIPPGIESKWRNLNEK